MVFFFMFDLVQKIDKNVTLFLFRMRLAEKKNPPRKTPVRFKGAKSRFLEGSTPKPKFLLFLNLSCFLP